MCEMKVYMLNENAQCVVEDSTTKVYLSAINRKPARRRRKHTVLQKVMEKILTMFYSLAVTYFVGKWAIAYAYLERGYKAVGGEYLLIIATFVFCFWAINSFFKSNRR